MAGICAAGPASSSAALLTDFDLARTGLVSASPDRGTTDRSPRLLRFTASRVSCRLSSKHAAKPLTNLDNAQKQKTWDAQKKNGDGPDEKLRWH
jgi:hypothetical protein